MNKNIAEIINALAAHEDNSSSPPLTQDRGPVRT